MKLGILYGALNILKTAAATAKSLQSCPTLCDPIDGSPPGSPIPWILQARTLEWVAISLSNAWKWKVKVKSLSHVRLLAAPWTVAHQAPPSMGFSRQEYWSGVPLPSPCWKERADSKKGEVEAGDAIGLKVWRLRKEGLSREACPTPITEGFENSTLICDRFKKTNSFFFF